jgi:acyl-CoA synthetase (AMP-forming)/AMP-acid ligase II
MLISDIVRYKARHQADRTALIFEDQSWTYAQLDDRVAALSRGLLTLASPGDRVAILSENLPEYVECYYGVPRAGMCLTFINYRLHPREIAWLVDHSEASVFITEPKYLPTVAEIRDQTPSVRHVVVIGEGAEADVSYESVLEAGRRSTAEPDNVDEKSIAWLLYTSGTTGVPKGAMLSHRNLIASVLNSAAVQGLDREAVTLFPWPLYHVAGFSIPVGHLGGGTIVLMRAYDPIAYLQHIDRYRATEISGAPTMLNMLLQQPEIDDFDLGSVKKIGYGAAPMPAELLRKAMKRFEGADFQTVFGMTELAGNITYLTPDDHRHALAEQPEMLTSNGQAMPLATARVVDDEDKEVPPGEVGELVVQGDQVTEGYWRNPEATETAFQGGWFHSGDLARIDEAGYLYIVDRKKDMIITGGENVFPREVEEVLYEHPAISELAVIGVPEETWGESIVAVVCPREGVSLTPEELIEFCKERLASYKKPRYVTFVDEIPRNPSGKVLKRELRDRFSDISKIPSS